MIQTALVLVVCVVLSGCATALHREAHCLASLTPDYLRAHEELTLLDSTWREAVRERLGAREQAGDRILMGRVGADPMSGQDGDTLPPAHSASQEAYRKLVEARARHRDTLQWYGKVYERVRLRLEEERMLADARMVLMAGLEGVLFYPIVRWNIRSVHWDGTDPDAESDPVTQYCTARLAKDADLAGLSPDGPNHLPGNSELRISEVGGENR